MKNFILVLVTVAAVIFAIGSAGAWCNDQISFVRFLIQEAISVGVEYLALKYIDM